MVADASVAPEGAKKDLDKNTLPTDKLNNGPVADRGCTDLICCLIFVGFISGMLMATGYGLIHGDPALLLTTYDANGNGCGYDIKTKDYPYLYFSTIDAQAVSKMSTPPSAASVTEVLKFTSCVKKCPSGNKEEPVECYPPLFMNNKKYYKDCVFYPAGVALGEQLRYETELAAGSFCVPSSEALKDGAVKQFKEEFNKYFGGSGITQYLADIVAAKEVLIITLFTAFFIGFLYMLVLRLFGGPMIYLSILAMIVGTTIGGYMLYERNQAMSDTEQYKSLYKYGAYVTWGLAVVLVCCVLANNKNIRIGVAVMKATAAYIGCNPHVFLVPPLACCVVLAWMALYCVIAAHIVSVGELKPNPNLKFLTTVVWDSETSYVFLYSLFGYLWINAFIIGVTQFMISASVALWYFSSTSDSHGKGSLTTGFWWVFRYHLGSIAVGSFLIALVQFIQIIFEYYKNQLEKAGKENKLVKILLCVTSYLLECLERFIKFISKNAYIQIALTGKNFCAAAWNAFILILKNALRFGTANSIGFIFNVLGVAFIASANGCVVYGVLHYDPKYKGLAQNWIGPSAVGIGQGFIIGAMFMSVFSFASDTILQSFLVDEELKRPGNMRPRMMNDFVDGITDENTNMNKIEPQKE